MAEGKKSFIAYSDWKDTFDALPNDKAGELIKHIFAYVNDESPITEDYLINAVFANIKNTLKRDLQKWDKQYEQRVKAGKKSAEVRKRNATTVNERSVSSTVSVSVSDSVTDIKKEKKPKTVFIPPSKKEFMVFARSKFKTEDLYQQSRDKLLLKFDSWSEADWINGRTEKKIKNWKVTLLNTIPHL